MNAGIVSNCWQAQIQQGVSLESLVVQARDRGYVAIELRQGCLGDCESSDDLVPDVERLSELAAACDGLTWDLALGYPCFAPGNAGDDAVFTAGCQAIGPLAAGRTPHLRLVDLQTDHTRVATAEAADTVLRLLTAVRRVGGLLSIEHAREDWGWFREVFDRARTAAGPDRDWLKICFDPCNLLLAPGEPDPATVTAGLAPAEISMIHFKQRRDGQPWPAVDEGEVDWAAVVRAINGMGDGQGFPGPYLFEIAPSPEVWECLDGSRVFLDRLGLEMGLGGGRNDRTDPEEFVETSS